VELTRHPQAGGAAIQFRLGDEVVPSGLTGAKALVHCAYDFTELSWANIRAKNVTGTEKLLRAARQAGVERLVYISSISAFEGCRSLYGKAKLETEAIAQSLGAVVIRPGLIYGEPPAGMFGRLVRQVEGASVLPLFGGGSQIQYLVHDADLCAFIVRCAEGAVTAPEAPITVANEQPWTFRQILEEIARTKGKRVTFVPVPWRLLWAGIKCAELCRVPLNFRSDSLVSLMYQNPAPSFELQRRLGIVCRPFKLTT
jgi:nucleoside-diphosphate-sugar epimerase